MVRTNAPATDLLENLGFLLAKAMERYNQRIVEVFAARGFPEVRASFGSVLVPLFEEDGLRVGELARRSRLSKQSMTGLVKLCHDAGLVVRELDPDDGRASRIFLSDRGQEFRTVALDTLDQLDAELVATLGQPDRDALITALKGVMNL